MYVHDHWREGRLISKANKKGMVHSNQTNQTQRILRAFPHCNSRDTTLKSFEKLQIALMAATYNLSEPILQLKVVVFKG